ncbi:pirin family protein [Litorivicinus lipolyticus]|uniref:Pirin family protein n=1 Tax=Litorivicinus lipolyticus TaxID=418701 RepID=A0A5Q2QF74_9GAMM|nr:pirin family protein [Litorivicinus lipolyticus]QGG80657.1 pirin family protein [Litorivicinus lipolyticus]
MYLRPANERGHANHGWLDSHHSFSFANYHDPKHMGFSVLRVINDDQVQPSMGFGTHGHQDMEIISYVMQGRLAHKDSEGNVETIPAGDVQIMSAGTGIQHSEFNGSDQEAVKFLQIWVLPSTAGGAPRYEQKTIAQTDRMTAIVSPSGGDSAVAIKQDMTLYRLMLNAGDTQTLEVGSRRGYLHVIEGQARAGGQQFGPGDGVGLENAEALTLDADEAFTALWFDLP